MIEVGPESNNPELGARLVGLNVGDQKQEEIAYPPMPRRASPARPSCTVSQ